MRCELRGMLDKEGRRGDKGEGQERGRGKGRKEEGEGKEIEMGIGRIWNIDNGKENNVKNNDNTRVQKMRKQSEIK